MKRIHQEVRNTQIFLRSDAEPNNSIYWSTYASRFLPNVLLFILTNFALLSLRSSKWNTHNRKAANINVVTLQYVFRMYYIDPWGGACCNGKRLDNSLIFPFTPLKVYIMVLFCSLVLFLVFLEFHFFLPFCVSESSFLYVRQRPSLR